MAWPKGRPQGKAHIAARVEQLRGQRRTPEQRATISASKMGKPRPPAAIAAMAEKLRGRSLAPEHRAKVIRTLQPNLRGMLGMHHTDATKARIAAAHRGNTYARDASVKGECAYCLGPATEHDHVVPLARGGSDDDSNIVLCCRFCNASKGNRTPEEWIG